MNPVRFAVEARLEFGQALRGTGKQNRKRNNQAAHCSQGRPAGLHALTFSVPACVVALCSAPWPARPDRDFYPDRTRETSGTPPKQASTGPAYRSKSRGQTRRLRLVVPFWLSRQESPAQPGNFPPEKT